MPIRGAIIFMDTCAIEGAHGANCWPAIYKNFKLNTEELCLQEATQPNKAGHRLVERETEELSREVKCAKCPEEDVIALAELLHDVADLDPGELRLLALALKNSDPWHLCGPDLGTLRALLHLSKLGANASMDNMCALESLTKELGMRTAFEGRKLFKLSEKWLQMARMNLLTGSR